MRCPIGLRRRLATRSPKTSTTTRQRNPKVGVGTPPCHPGNGPLGPMSTPKSLGSGTGAPPPMAAPHFVLSRPKFSMATMPATVRMARLTPRTRKRGQRDDHPEDGGDHDRDERPRAGTRSRHRPPVSTRRARRCRPDPTWISEIWPVNPVMTTSERHSEHGDQRVDQRPRGRRRSVKTRSERRRRRPRAAAGSAIRLGTGRPAGAARRAHRGSGGSGPAGAARS